jgi:hypothetical protein
MDSDDATNAGDDMATGRRSANESAVKIEGLSSVQRQLRKLSSEVDYNTEEFLGVHKALASAVAGDSKQFVPVLTGALRDSLRAFATKKSARVKAGGNFRGVIEYAGPIHFGWPARRIQPQPFIYDAIDRRRNEVKERYEKLVNDLIKKHDLEDKRVS